MFVWLLKNFFFVGIIASAFNLSDCVGQIIIIKEQNVKIMKIFTEPLFVQMVIILNYR